MAKIENKKFDIRILRRNIQKGIISKKEYEGFIASLPDEEGNYDLTPLMDEDLEQSQPEEAADATGNNFGLATDQELDVEGDEPKEGTPETEPGLPDVQE